MWTGWERKCVYIDKSNLYFNEVQPSKEEIKNIYIDPFYRFYFKYIVI